MKRDFMTNESRLRDAEILSTPQQFETALQKHVIDVWFPRSLDHEHGGFLCDFDRRWRSCGPQNKLAEFQARHTLFAAEAAKVFPEDNRLHEAALHGFAYLRDKLWDHDSGGWFHRLDREGRPLEDETKHVHGMGYAIQACAAIHSLTGDRTALNLALEGFDWLETYAHDKQHGGYFGYLKRDGAVIRTPLECPWESDLDTISTPIGCKDFNVHSDMLEALVGLFRVSEHPLVRQRSAEIADILCTKSVTRAGALHFFAERDWTPVPHLVRFGYAIQSATRLLSARDILADSEKTVSVASHLAEHVIQFGWDEIHGGFFFANAGIAPTSLQGVRLLVPSKSWWVQVEALKMFLALHQAVPNNEQHRSHFTSLWDYIQGNFLDRRFGGFYVVGQDVRRSWRSRLRSLVSSNHTRRKGDVWKDASHDGRALLYCRQHAACIQGGQSKASGSRTPTATMTS